MLRFLIPVLFVFYIQSVLYLKQFGGKGLIILPLSSVEFKERVEI